MEQPRLTEQDRRILQLARTVLEHDEQESIEAETTETSPDIIYRSSEADTTELTEYEQFELAYTDIRYSGSDVIPLIRFLQRRGADILVREDYVGDVSDFEEPDWIVDGIIVRNGLTLLYGESGVGKTTFLLNMADSIQRRVNLFGRDCRQGTVLFIEQDETGQLLRQHRDIMQKPNPLLVARKDIVWEGRHFCVDFDNTLRVCQADVVIVDSYTSLGIEDITRPESGLVFDELRRKARQYNCAICIVHHTSLSGRPMGSSLHIAKVDSMIALNKAASGDGFDTINIIQEKIRGTRFEPLTLRFYHTTLEMRPLQATLKDQVRELFFAGTPDDEIVSMFPPTQRSTIRRYLREFRRS